MFHVNNRHKATARLHRVYLMNAEQHKWSLATNSWTTPNYLGYGLTCRLL